MITLTAEQLTAPCNYRVFDNWGHVLYVGCGVAGMGRVFDFTPEQKGRVKAFQRCSVIEVEFFRTKDRALKAEGDLIHEWHPRFNAFCPRCNHYVKKRPKRLQGRGVLFGKSRHAILSLMFENPEKAYSTREVMRLVGSNGAAQRELKTLSQPGTCVLRRTKRGNQVFYQAETNSPYYNELRSMVLKGA